MRIRLSGERMDISTAWMNGRSLAKALNHTKARHAFGKFSLKQRVPLDVERNLYALGIEFERGFPFVVDTNLFVTVQDVDAPSGVLRFGNIRLTENALAGALGWTDDSERKKASKAEAKGRRLSLSSPANTLAFSEAVCDWGDGRRVWVNLNRHNPSPKKLAEALGNWLVAARSTSDYADAIAPSSRIKGLGVSFASKHLRMLEPARFATLDDVLHQGLGYALNPAGYSLFMRDLTAFRDAHSKETRIADLEAAIFDLTRQLVRSTDQPGR